MSSKLAILGPPRIVAEVPETLHAARGLFSSCGYAEEAILTDYAREAPGTPALPERGEPAPVGGFVIPITVDDLAANGLLPEADTAACWERSAETLTARKGDIEGFAVASDERIEACLLCARTPTAEILSLRSFVEDDGARLKQLLARLGAGTCRFPKVHPNEASPALLQTLGFRPAGGHLLYAARAAEPRR